MNRKTVKWLIAAITLILIGCILFVGVMMHLRWDFMKLSTVRYETNHHEISEPFQDISIETSRCSIQFEIIEDEKISVRCDDSARLRHSVSIKEGALTIKEIDERKWYDHIGIHFGSPKILLSIPQGEYGALSIRSDTGDIEIPQNFRFESIDIEEHTGEIRCLASAADKIRLKTSTGGISLKEISATSLELAVSTGKVNIENAACKGDITLRVSTGDAELRDVRCKNFASDGDTGDLHLKNVIAAEAFTIERSTGDIRMEQCDAAALQLQTDTGDIRGSLLSEKIFWAESDTGRIDLPKTTAGGICEIQTDTGDIKIKIS